ncbi:MAG: FUSC family protein [Stellaceae bacterium]
MPIDEAKKFSPRREIAAATGDLIKLQRGELHPGAAECCVPAIVIILVCGRVFDQPYAALVATAGAFSVGFGLFQRLSSFAIVPMLLALLGMTVSATVGTLAGASPLSEGIAAAIWAFGVAAAAGLGAAVWWIVLQWSIALVIAAAFPADPTFALLRGMLVALGGSLQLVIASSLWALVCWGCDIPAPRNANARPLSLESVCLALRETMELDNARFRYAVALAVTTGFAAAAYRAVDFSNGYWIAMTILIVLRSELRDTVRITLTRIIGTMAGGLATVIVALLRPSQTILVTLIAAMAWGCYALLRVNYALFSMLITGYIALLFAFGGLPEPLVALDRVIATAIGGSVALAAHFLYVARPPRRGVRKAPQSRS